MRKQSANQHQQRKVRESDLIEGAVKAFNKLAKNAYTRPEALRRSYEDFKLGRFTDANSPKMTRKRRLFRAQLDNNPDVAKAINSSRINNLAKRYQELQDSFDRVRESEPFNNPELLDKVKMMNKNIQEKIKQVKSKKLKPLPQNAPKIAEGSLNRSNKMKESLPLGNAGLAYGMSKFRNKKLRNPNKTIPRSHIKQASAELNNKNNDNLRRGNYGSNAISESQAIVLHTLLESEDGFTLLVKRCFKRKGKTNHAMMHDIQNKGGSSNYRFLRKIQNKGE